MKYRPEIDGLRALAVVPVILFHAGFGAFSGGYIGVDVFFVISGYLITNLLLADLDSGRFSITRFYERRARRILPALFLVMTVCIPFAGYLMLPRDFESFSLSVLAATLFSSNVLFWRQSGYFDTAAEMKPLLHTWSLGIEEQFYILYPLLLLLIWRHARRHLGIVLLVQFAVSLLLAHFLSDRSPNANFYLLPTRGWELLTGAYLAYRESVLVERGGGRFAPALCVLGLLAIVWAVLTFDATTAHPSLLTLVPVLGTAAVIRYGHAPGLANRVLSLRAVVGIGLISYSLYLWHHPLFVFARYLSFNPPSGAVMAGLVMLSLGLAALSYRYVEKPFRDRQRMSARRIWIVSATAMSALVAVAVLGIATEGLPSRLPAEQIAIAENRQQIGSGHHFVDGKPCTNRPIPESCHLGRSDAAVTWALVGDSHAAMLSPSFDAALAGHGLGGVEYTYAGCAYAVGLVMVRRSRDECLQRNEEVRAALLESDIGNVVISGRYLRSLLGTGYDNGEGGIETDEGGFFAPTEPVDEAERQRRVMASYENSITELLDAGKVVYLIYPVPGVGWDARQLWFKRARAGIFDPITTDASVFYARAKPIIDLFDSLGDRPNLMRIRPDRILCNTVVSGRCTTEIDGELLYDDDDHLNRAGANLVTAKILGMHATMNEELRRATIGDSQAPQ